MITPNILRPAEAQDWTESKCNNESSKKEMATHTPKTLDKRTSELSIDDRSKIKRLDEGSELFVNKNIEQGEKNTNAIKMLFEGCQNGPVEKVEELLNDGLYRCNLYEGVDGIKGGAVTPLICAIISKQNGIVKLLLEKGAVVNATCSNNNTALHVSLRENDAVVKLLVEHKADIRAKNGEGNTPLHLAARHSSYETIMLLVDMDNGDLINNKNNASNTPMHECCLNYRSRDKSIECLINNGCNVNIINDDGNNLLHSVVKSNIFSTAIFKQVLKKITGVNETNNCGKSALHMLALRSYQTYKPYKYPVDMYDNSFGMLLTRDDINVNIKDNDGNTPLHCLINTSENITVREFRIGDVDKSETERYLTREDRINMLLGHKKIVVDVKNKNNQTPLMFLMRHESLMIRKDGFMKVLDALIKKGANPNLLCNKSGEQSYLTQLTGWNSTETALTKARELKAASWKWFSTDDERKFTDFLNNVVEKLEKATLRPLVCISSGNV